MAFFKERGMKSLKFIVLCMLIGAVSVACAVFILMNLFDLLIWLDVYIKDNYSWSYLILYRASFVGFLIGLLFACIWLDKNSDEEKGEGE
jgi:uncharacterized membrane protein YqjE